MSSQELPPMPHLIGKRRCGFTKKQRERERESAMHRGKVLASSTEVGISMPHLGTWRLFGAGRGRGRELI